MFDAHVLKHTSVCHSV